MAMEVFSIETFAKIDGGRVGEALKQAIQRCYSDCNDRPNIKKPRVVTMRIEIEPVPDEGNGDLDTCNVQFRVIDNAPERKSKVYNMLARRGGLLWNELSPDDVKQMTLDDASGPKKAVADAR